MCVSRTGRGKGKEGRYGKGIQIDEEGHRLYVSQFKVKALTLSRGEAQRMQLVAAEEKKREKWAALIVQKHMRGRQYRLSVNKISSR